METTKSATLGTKDIGQHDCMGRTCEVAPLAAYEAPTGQVLKHILACHAADKALHAPAASEQGVKSFPPTFTRR